MTEPQRDDTELLVGDNELIEAVREGDTAAYATLYERHAGAARGLARQLVRGESEVDDIVAETFTRVLGVVQRGGGPKDGFRPYLLSALRNVAYDRFRGDKRQVVTDDMENFDSGEPFVDPALEGLERSLIARAFLSLPDRWQAVLWHTEIEGVKPAEAASLLGMSANGVAALAYRAREGLRQAYLQMHLAGGATAEPCRPVLGLLGAYVRGGLAKRDTTTVGRHLDACSDCREVYAELTDVNVGLRGVILPLFAGPAAAAYLAGLPSGTLAAGWWGRMPRHQQSAAAGTGVAAVAAAAALALVNDEEPRRPEQPPAAAPPEGGASDPPDRPAPPAPPPAAQPNQPPPPPAGQPAEQPAPPKPPEPKPPDPPRPDPPEPPEPEPPTPPTPPAPPRPEPPEPPEPPKPPHPDPPDLPDPPKPPRPEPPERPHPPDAPDLPNPPDPPRPEPPGPPGRLEPPTPPDRPAPPAPPGHRPESAGSPDRPAG